MSTRVLDGLDTVILDSVAGGLAGWRSTLEQVYDLVATEPDATCVARTELREFAPITDHVSATVHCESAAAAMARDVTVSFGPADDAPWSTILQGSPGRWFENEDVRAITRSYDEPLDRDQSLGLLQHLRAAASGPPEYALLSSNCATEWDEARGAAGLEPLGRTPADMHIAIAERMGQR